MSRKHKCFVLGIVILAMALPGITHAEEILTSVIQGRAFVDENNNGAYDEGETVITGMVIEFANGEDILSVTTAEDGTYSIQVGEGLWRVSLFPHEGYTLLDEVSPEAIIDADVPTVVVMDFLLRSVCPEGLEEEGVECDQETEDQIITVEEVIPEDARMASGIQSEEGDISEEDIPLENRQPTILPESGGSMPSWLLSLIVLIGLLLCAVILILIGRRLMNS